ncbi:hypothetical protein NLG97_g8260 [Lecanicillium saksenae]|uniref:Uncharacterized protein n=1 Tax=Lecanicillium saksenae TaxID=468837 RepID=A0ACC1QK03_9HYPO|nr:hypothetical protein NLG97_g8260 [Lecanicillium saksenae]
MNQSVYMDILNSLDGLQEVAHELTSHSNLSGKTRGRLRGYSTAPMDFITQPESDLLYDQESVHCYHPGGCHPVLLGDVFDGRYKITRKLGWGNSSTVWLAKDTQCDGWVALKILTSEKSSASQEPAFLAALCRDTTTAGLIPTFRGKFLHNGPNRTHLCIATSLLGPKLKNVIESYGDHQIDAKDILRLSRQILEAVCTVHEAGFAHGDLDSTNVVFTLRHLAGASDETLLEAVGELETTTLLCADGAPTSAHMPSQLVRAATWDNWVDEDEEDVCFVDFGSSFRVGDAMGSSDFEHSAVSPPETILADTFDYRIDLWRVGCIIHSLIFAAYPCMYMGDDFFLILQIIYFVEELPQEWEPKWQQVLAASRNPQAKPTPSPDPTMSKLEYKFHTRVSEADLKPLLPVIKGLMRFRPQDRISAREALALLPPLSDDDDFEE